MKRILLLLLLSSPICYAEEWTKEEQHVEIAYQLLHVVDWAQTRNIAREPDKWHEVNPVIGKHPTVSQVDKYFLASSLLHLWVVDVLPIEYRQKFQYSTIIVKMGLVAHNFNVGISANF